MPKPKNLPALLSVDKYTEQVAKDATIAVMRLVDTYESQVGKGQGIRLLSTFLQTFIGTAVFAVLSREQRMAAAAGKKVGHEEAERTMDAYRNFKVDVQDAIATGYGDAAFQFSGRNTDYYCQIQIVPEPINDQPC